LKTEFEFGETDMSFYMFADFGLGYCTYFFSKDSICTSCSFKPNNKDILEFYIDKFNNEYIQIDSTKWNIEINGQTLNVEVDYDKEYDITFILYKIVEYE
jgi:disulfide oxidoreductase YuzD